MALADFLNTPFSLTKNGTNTSLLADGGIIAIKDTGRAKMGVKRLGIEASGFGPGANSAWNAVDEAIHIDIPGGQGIVVGRVADIDLNTNTIFVIYRDGDNFRLTLNWDLNPGQVGGGPPEDGSD